jgi:subtilisin family serine protease
MPPGKARSSFTKGMRASFKALAAGAVLAIVAVPPAPAAELGAAGASARAWPRAEATIGYSTPSALRTALARFPAVIVHRVPALHVAEVRPLGSIDAFAGNILGRPGIRFVQRLALRDEKVEPALAVPTGRSVPWEWQYSATREDFVPVDVQRAASAITIAVIDTGADVSAPDLAAKNPITYNQRTGSSDVHDTVGHGTFVSALAAGSVTNGDGIAGFGGDAQLMVIKAGSGDGSFTDLDEASAIVYAVDHGARIINLSLGGPSTSTTERKAIDYATSHGTLVVAAAGNEYQDGNPAEYPAALLQPLGSRGVGGRGLAVGASTMSGSRAIFSNTGSYLSLVAPGDNVYSAVSSLSPTSRFPRVPLPGSLSGVYGYASGTSFAAPEVAGAAALVWAANPLLDATGVAEILKESASSGGVWTADLGWGVLDVGAAVARASGVQPTTSNAFLSLSSVLRARTATFRAELRAAAPGVPPAARIVALEVYDGARWQGKGQSTTSAMGEAVWKLKLKHGTYRVRARWAGAGDLAGAISKTIVIRVS